MIFIHEKSLIYYSNQKIFMLILNQPHLLILINLPSINIPLLNKKAQGNLFILKKSFAAYKFYGS